MLNTLHFQIHEIAPYINWLYFFHTWGFPARLASIARVHGCEACRQNWLMAFQPTERARAREAMRLYDEAQQLLKESDGRMTTHARVGIFPASSSGDDVILSLEGCTATIPFLRQQHPGENGFCLCLSDFIRPQEKGSDELGIWACSVDRELEEGEADNDYRHLLHQTLADRLAEATAERMHEIVRKEMWGFSPNERLTTDELFSEQYQGLRPAVGYPSIPDQSMTFLLEDLIGMSQIGITLTESGAMRPHASTCGFILSHPSSMHFSVGNIEEDQLADYAQRRGMSAEDMKRFVS